MILSAQVTVCKKKKGKNIESISRGVIIMMNHGIWTRQSGKWGHENDEEQ